MTISHRRTMTVWALLLTAALGASPLAQTIVSAPPNKYTPAQDVQLGQKAASQVEQEMPLLHDDLVTSYVQGIGERLVTAIRPDLRQPEFSYTFQVVNVSDINAFALPGGPMFVNRGMIEAAHDEGEIAGVMAHEISHVVLRHGTAQASKASRYEVGQAAGAVLGAIIGGIWGSVISQGTQFGLGAAFLRFSREFERDADIEGSHMMARAGYDPRAMAEMFRTIEKQSGPGGPAWLSDHPNPGDRSGYITEEAAHLQIQNAVREARDYERVQAHLKTLPKAPTTQEAAKAAERGAPPDTTGGSGAVGGRVAAPSSRYRIYEERGLYRLSVPDNWRELAGTGSVTYAPEGGYGRTRDGQSVFIYGVQVGTSRTDGRDLGDATDGLINALARGNPRLRRLSDPERLTVGGRRGLRVRLTNVSDVTGRDEAIDVYTSAARNGDLFYLIAVAPASAYRAYQTTFDRIVASIELTD